MQAYTGIIRSRPGWESHPQQAKLPQHLKDREHKRIAIGPQAFGNYLAIFQGNIKPQLNLVE